MRSLTKKKHEPLIEMVHITPELAAEYLSGNTSNRPIRNKRVAALRDAILRGDWIFDASPIRLAEDGTLIDGQHRLWAIIEAGVSVPSYVAYGLEPRAFSVIDSGASRNGGDTLAVKGYKYGVQLANAARLYMNHYSIDGGCGNLSRRYINAQTLGCVEENPSLYKYMEQVRGLSWCAKFINRGTFAAICTIIEDAGAPQSQILAFMYALETGEGLKKGSPVLALRNSLTNFKLTKGSDSVYGSYSRMVMVTKAWNSHVADKKVVRVSARTGELVPTILTE